jgi:hypothetical protein
VSRLAVLTVVVFALSVAPAWGSGGPVVGGDARQLGVTADGIGARYVAQRVQGGTLLESIDRDGGRILNSRFFDRHLMVPAVAFDGSGSGLTADGTTLVLASPLRGSSSRFTVIDTRTLRVRQTITLRGHFALDAVSPDGHRLYFIEVLSGDGTRYAVRAYDMDAGRLLRAPVVDPAEADEPMRGSPISRVMSTDGRWAYTLYDGGDKAPFIHALDTVLGRAKCVDLDALAGRQDVYDMRVDLGADGAVVVSEGATHAVLRVDPRTFAVTPVHSAPPPAPAPSSGTGWVEPIVGVALLGLLAALALWLGRRRRESGADLGQLRL